MTISFAMPAYATDGDEVFIPEEFIAEELNAWAEQHEIGVRFDNINVELLDGEMSDDEIEASVRAYVDMMKTIYTAVGEMFSDINNLGIEIFELSVCPVQYGYRGWRRTLWLRPTEAEKELMWELLEDCSRQKYGCTLEEFPAVFQRMCQAKNEVALA